MISMNPVQWALIFNFMASAALTAIVVGLVVVAFLAIRGRNSKGGK